MAEQDPNTMVHTHVDENGNVIKQGFDYYLKPMNCPMHNLIFKSRQRSYRCHCACSNSVRCIVTRSPARCMV